MRVSSRGSTVFSLTQALKSFYWCSLFTRFRYLHCILLNIRYHLFKTDKHIFLRFSSFFFIGSSRPLSRKVLRHSCLLENVKLGFHQHVHKGKSVPGWNRRRLQQVVVTRLAEYLYLWRVQSLRLPCKVLQRIWQTSKRSMRSTYKTLQT